MPAPSERDTLAAKRKLLEEDAKAFAQSEAARNPENVVSGATDKKKARYIRDIEEIDQRLTTLEKK